MHPFDVVSPLREFNIALPSPRCEILDAFLSGNLVTNLGRNPFSKIRETRTKRYTRPVAANRTSGRLPLQNLRSTEGSTFPDSGNGAFPVPTIHPLACHRESALDRAGKKSKRGAEPREGRRREIF